jgi:hypothetical protein
MRTAVILFVLLGMSALGGCQRALFPKDAPRTQYETYDRMRSKAPPLTEPDAFGDPQPALRARLSQTQ